jgi:hypothetical protein
MVKPRTCFVALLFSTAFCLAVGLEVKSFVRETNTVSNREFRWSSGGLDLSLSATHSRNWDDYVLQIDGRQFLRLTTGKSQLQTSDNTVVNSTPLEHRASLQTGDTNNMASVDPIGYWATGNTTPSAESIRLASIFRPCGANRIHKNEIEGLATAVLSQ